MTQEKPGANNTGLPCKSIDPTDQHQRSGAADVRRRLDAARRSPPLRCGDADPWRHQCTTPTTSQKMIAAAHQARAHLLELGLPPLGLVDGKQHG
jgi:hypothetical protein